MNTDRVVPLLYALLLLSVLGVVYIGVVAPPSAQSGPSFTEFYLLGSSGNASEYNTTVGASEEVSYTVGITNQEGRDTTYRVVASWNGTVEQTRSVTVARGQDVQSQLQVETPDQPGRYRLEFMLYRTGVDSEEPYRNLRLFVEVTERD